MAKKDKPISGGNLKSGNVKRVKFRKKKEDDEAPKKVEDILYGEEDPENKIVVTNKERKKEEDELLEGIPVPKEGGLFRMKDVIVTQEDIAEIVLPEHISQIKDNKIKDQYYKLYKAKGMIDTHPLRYGNYHSRGDFNNMIIIDRFSRKSEDTVNNFCVLTEDEKVLLKNVKNRHNRQMLILRDFEISLADKLAIKNVNIGASRSTSLIIDLAGKFYAIDEIIEQVREKKGYHLTYDDCKRVISLYNGIIEQKRKQYMADARAFRIATESGRIEVLNKLLDYWNREFNKKSNTLKVSAEIRAILEQARKEVKGNQVELTVNGQIDLNASMQGKANIMRLMSSISINALVIGLTAAKVGISPSTLMAQLTSSWYKDVNGFTANAVDPKSIQLPSLLIKQYNWNEMEGKSNSFLQNVHSLAEETEYEEVEKVQKAEAKRTSVLEAIQRLKKGL